MSQFGSFSNRYSKGFYSGSRSPSLICLRRACPSCIYLYLSVSASWYSSCRRSNEIMANPLHTSPKWAIYNSFHLLNPCRLPTTFNMSLSQSGVRSVSLFAQPRDLMALSHALITACVCGGICFSVLFWYNTPG